MAGGYLPQANLVFSRITKYSDFELRHGVGLLLHKRIFAEICDRECHGFIKGLGFDFHRVLDTLRIHERHPAPRHEQIVPRSIRLLFAAIAPTLPAALICGGGSDPASLSLTRCASAQPGNDPATHSIRPQRERSA